MITATPSFFAVTRPVASTTAISSSELLQMTESSVASEGITNALSCSLSSFSSIIDDIAIPLRLMETPSTCVGTKTVHVSSNPPSAVTTLITAVPSFFEVTNPVLSTVATVSSELFQETELSVASKGVTYESSFFVASFSSVISEISSPLLLIETAFTGTMTSISHVAVFPPSLVVTVTIAVPLACAVTIPSLSMVSISSSELYQLTDLSVVSSGDI